VVDAALRANPEKMPLLVGVDLGAQGYAVVRVNKVVPRPEASAQLSEQSRQQFARLWGQAEAQAYLASLKAKYKVEMRAEKPAKLTDSEAKKS
jgi:peptidyl-prolyl cis-trans isomerase D